MKVGVYFFKKFEIFTDLADKVAVSTLDFDLIFLLEDTGPLTSFQGVSHHFLIATKKFDLFFRDVGKLKLVFDKTSIGHFQVFVHRVQIVDKTGCFEVGELCFDYVFGIFDRFHDVLLREK